jgi:hypothetical protein
VRVGAAAGICLFAACGGQASHGAQLPEGDSGAAQNDDASPPDAGPEAASDVRDDAVNKDALGLACATDADCGSLHCIRPSDDLGIRGSGGPAHGYCSLDCRAQVQTNSNDVCGSLDAFCIHFGPPGFAGPAWCIKTCALRPVDKCLGRPDVACSLVGNATATRALCMPLCAVDADCNGRRCNPATGFCDDDPAVDDRMYASCKAPPPGGANIGCPEICAAAYQPAAGQTAPGLCTRNCVVGSIDGCGRSSGLPISSGRVGTCVGDNGSVPGDLGECYQLCDAVADCRDQDPGTTCDPFLQAVLGHGVCLPPDMSLSDAGAAEASAIPVDASTAE